MGSVGTFASLSHDERQPVELRQRRCPVERLGNARIREKLLLTQALAEAAGLRAGDRITSIDGTGVTRWKEFVEVVEAAGRNPLRIGVDRDEGAVEIELGPAGPGGLGLHNSVRAAVLGVRSLDGPAGRAGLRSGDRVRWLNGAEIEDWSGLVAALSAAPGALELEVERPDPAGSRTPGARSPAGERLRMTIPAVGKLWSPAELGVVSGDLEVQTVLPDSPAARAGILPGDLLIEAAGTPLESFPGFAEVVRSSGGAPIQLLLARAGEEVELEVTDRVERHRLPRQTQLVEQREPAEESEEEQ